MAALAGYPAGELGILGVHGTQRGVPDRRKVGALEGLVVAEGRPPTLVHLSTMPTTLDTCHASEFAWEAERYKTYTQDSSKTPLRLRVP